MYESFKNTELPEKKCQHSTEIPEGEAFSNSLANPSLAKHEKETTIKNYYREMKTRTSGKKFKFVFLSDLRRSS